jgi:hypothetical protein
MLLCDDGLCKIAHEPWVQQRGLAGFLTVDGAHEDEIMHAGPARTQ